MLFSLLASVMIITLLLLWIGLDAFYQAFSSLQPIQLGLMFLLFLLSIFLRGWRFALTINGCLSLPRAKYFAVASLHNIANQVMPMRSGELTYPYLLRRYFGHEFAKGTASLLYIRFFEILVLALLFSVALVGFAAHQQGYDFSRVMLGVVLLVLLSGLLWFKLPAIINFISRWMAVKVGGRTGFTGDFLQKLSLMLASLSLELKQTRPLVLHSAIAILTVMNWLCLFMIFDVVLDSLGIALTFYEVVIGSSFASIAQFVPLGTLGNFGSLEAGWTAGFMLVGVGIKQALYSGLIMHVIVFACSLLLAAISWISLTVYERRRSKV